MSKPLKLIDAIDRFATASTPNEQSLEYLAIILKTIAVQCGCDLYGEVGLRLEKKPTNQNQKPSGKRGGAMVM